MPTYDLDGISVRIPVSSISDQGTVVRSLALNELVEIFSKCLDLCCAGSRWIGLKLTPLQVSIALKKAALLMPFLKEDVLRVIENVVPNIVTSCHFLLRVCE